MAERQKGREIITKKVIPLIIIIGILGYLSNEIKGGFYWTIGDYVSISANPGGRCRQGENDECIPGTFIKINGRDNGIEVFVPGHPSNIEFIQFNLSDR